MGENSEHKKMRRKIEALEKRVLRYEKRLNTLERQERALRSLIEHSALGIVAVDKNFNVTYCNKVFERLFQYKKSEILGKNLDHLIARNRSLDEAEDFSKEVLKGRPTRARGIRYRKDGSPVYVEFYAAPMVIEGEIVGTYGMYQDVSEKEELAQALMESEERYRQLVDFSPIPIGVYDEKNFYYGNRAAFQLLGISSAEGFRGRTLFDFIHPAFRDVVRERHKRLMRGETLPVIDLKLVRLDGEVIEVEVYSTPVVFEKKAAVMSILTDVTERRRAEARLREEEEKFRKLYQESKRKEALYRSLLESSSDAIVIYNLAGEVEFISPSFTKIFGWTFEEIKGKRIPFVPEPEKEISMQLIHRLFETGIPIHGFETRRLTKDGRFLDISISASCYNDHEGKRHGMLVVLRDITEKKRAEKQIRESERRFRDLFDSVSDLIYTQDLQGRFLSANRALISIFGITHEEFIGRPASDFMRPELRSRFEEEYLRVVKEKGCCEGVSTYYTKDNRKIYLEYRSTLVHPEGGEPYISGIARDVTDRILAERRIKRLQEEMLQVQKMEAIGTLAGGIAHDFNNLLMGIQGNVSLLKLRVDPNGTEYERLKHIEEYIQSGSELTMQLLGFARGGRYEVTVTNLNDLIGKEVSLFGRTKKEIEIQVKFQEDLWPVEIDQGQMEQVFLNLFVNAWQAMPKGGHLYVQTENVLLEESPLVPSSLASGKYVKITVSDTGVGMDEETQKRIFEPFFTTKKKGRGTGLGLASVYGIIKNHGGTIEVESEIGQGATFTIYLPATDKVIQEVHSEGQEQLVSGKGSILFVDDEERILDVGKQLLEVLGYEVTTASSGQKALEIFGCEKGAFDLVVLDMIMPGMGGQEVFEALKKMDPHVKVLLASGYSISGQASEIMAKGCNGFIQKPFSMEKLSKKIDEIMKGK